MNERLEKMKNEITPNDTVIQKTLSASQSTRHFPVKGVISAAACFAIIFGIFAVTKGMSTVNISTVTTAPQTVNGADCLVKPWSEMTISERFCFFNYNGDEYDCAVCNQTMGEGHIGQKISDIIITAKNCDTQTDESINAALYEINGISKAAYIAVKYEGDDRYYGFHNVNYKPQTLGELINAVSLCDNLFSSEISVHKVENKMASLDKAYELNDLTQITEILLAAADSPACDRDKYSVTYIDIYCRLGWDNESYEDTEAIGISDNGYVKFSFVGEDVIYYIGAEAVQQIKTIVETQGTLIQQW